MKPADKSGSSAFPSPRQTYLPESSRTGRWRIKSTSPYLRFFTAAWSFFSFIPRKISQFTLRSFSPESSLMNRNSNDYRTKVQHLLHDHPSTRDITAIFRAENSDTKKNEMYEALKKYTEGNSSAESINMPTLKRILKHTDSIRAATCMVELEANGRMEIQYKERRLLKKDQSTISPEFMGIIKGAPNLINTAKIAVLLNKPGVTDAAILKSASDRDPFSFVYPALMDLVERKDQISSEMIDFIVNAEDIDTAATLATGLYHHHKITSKDTLDLAYRNNQHNRDQKTGRRWIKGGDSVSSEEILSILSGR